MLENVVLPIVVIILLVVLNGLFVAAEFALVGAKRSRLQTIADNGNNAARWLVGVFDKANGKDAYIAIAQLGITFASIGLGMYGEPAVARWLYEPFENWGLSYELAHTAGFFVALSFITFMHVVFGEMIPKALALQMPENISIRVNPLMRVFGFIFRPMVVLLNALAFGLMRLFRIPEPDKSHSLYTSKELAIVTEEAAHSGQINAIQSDLINNIFELEERTAEELMTSRSRMEVLAANTTVEELNKRISESVRSRYPVYEDHLDQIIGVLHIKDFMRIRVQGQSPELAELVRPLPNVAASATAEELLALFKRERLHAALVVDEFGGTLGFVTMNDLIADVMDEDDEREALWINKNIDGSLSLDGEVKLAELQDDHDIYLNHSEVSTIAGLMLLHYGTVPDAGVTVHVQSETGQAYDLTAEEVQGLKVMRVRLRQVQSRVTQT